MPYSDPDRIFDLSALNELKSLATLTLDTLLARKTNLSSLKDLKHLSVLALHAPQLTNDDLLSEFPNLTCIDIAGSQIRQLRYLGSEVTTLKLGVYVNDTKLSR